MAASVQAQAQGIASSIAAVKSVVDAGIPLSPEGQGMVTLVNVLAQSVTGQSLQQLGQAALNEGIGAIAELVPQMADIVGDVADVLPIIGTAVKIIAAIIGFASTMEQQTETTQAQRCAAWQQSARVVNVDSKEITPSDIFAAVYVPGPVLGDPDIFSTVSGPVSYVGPGQDPNNRMSYPAIGWALMRVTEGWGFSEKELAIMTAGSRAADPTDSSNAGVDAKTRALFKQLRMAIQGELGGPLEGILVWPVYLDLLRHVQSAGQLSPVHMANLLSNGVDPDTGAIAAGDCSGANLADQILEMIRQWKIQLNPTTAADQQARAQLLASIKKQATSAFSSKGGKGMATKLDFSGMPLAQQKQIALNGLNDATNDNALSFWLNRCKQLGIVYSVRGAAALKARRTIARRGASTQGP